MKTFKEFLEESSLSRIKSKSDKSGIAALSADRGATSPPSDTYLSVSLPAAATPARMWQKLGFVSKCISVDKKGTQKMGK